jgi:hypothetical protein
MNKQRGRPKTLLARMSGETWDEIRNAMMLRKGATASDIFAALESDGLVKKLHKDPRVAQNKRQPNALDVADRRFENKQRALDAIHDLADKVITSWRGLKIRCSLSTRELRCRFVAYKRPKNCGFR